MDTSSNLYSHFNRQCHADEYTYQYRDCYSRSYWHSHPHEHPRPTDGDCHPNQYGLTPDSHIYQYAGAS
jgi:hypothetical protein